MAGVDQNDSGTPISYGEQPAQGGSEYRSKIGMTLNQAKIVASAHMDGNRAEGVSYPETQGVMLDERAYPAGTQMKDNTPGDHVN